jgi:hypothetical protein
MNLFKVKAEGQFSFSFSQWLSISGTLRNVNKIELVVKMLTIEIQFGINKC